VAHLVPKSERPCARCNTTFKTHLPQRLYCSNVCGYIARGDQRAEPYAERVCALSECTISFVPKHAKQRCCSERHGKTLYNRESRADGRQAMNSGDPAKRRARLRIKTQMRRARTKTDEAEKVDRDVVGERDGWKCGICRRKVNRALAYPHPRSASLDHVIPLSEHGPHTYANCRIAHLDCNNLRSDRGGNEQLALVG
jgi:hypothetical protein